jgi:hypothetical protein
MVLIATFTAPHHARAAGVVGNGTPASCTDAALDAALAGGGAVTFDCGGAAIIDISAGTGTKTITADTTIDGGKLITISGGKQVGVFAIDPGVNFTVKNLVIADAELGGAIVNFGDGSLTVADCTFNGNIAGTGAAIASGGGTLTVTNSVFTGNRASVGGAINIVGGAVERDGVRLSITGSAFVGNSAFIGGAIASERVALVVTACSFTGNSALEQEFQGIGGAIALDSGAFGPPDRGSLTVTDSAFTDNNARIGGGISTRGSLTVLDSTFSGNTAEILGGGIDNRGTTTIIGCTFVGNSAGVGGCIATSRNGVGMLSVANCTFAGNSAFNNGGGISNINGTSGSLTIANSTFTGNSAPTGGGIVNIEPGPVVNTILANSPHGGNCFGTLTDGGHNLDDGTSCGFGTANGSLSSTRAELDPAGLQDNGGRTQTVALCTAVGVPAGCTAASSGIEAGDQDACATAPVNNRDQRGFVRPGTGHRQCSMGAYEPDAAAEQLCVGDCMGTHTVAISDLVTLVSIALGDMHASCPSGVPSGAEVTVALIIEAVNNALNACAAG